VLGRAWPARSTLLDAVNGPGAVFRGEGLNAPAGSYALDQSLRRLAGLLPSRPLSGWGFSSQVAADLFRVDERWGPLSGPACWCPRQPARSVECSRARALCRLPLATWPDRRGSGESMQTRGYASRAAGGGGKNAQAGDRRRMAGPPDCAQSRPAPSIRSGSRSTSLWCSATGPPALRARQPVSCPTSSQPALQRVHGAKDGELQLGLADPRRERNPNAAPRMGEAFAALSPSLGCEPLPCPGRRGSHFATAFVRGGQRAALARPELAAAGRRGANPMSPIRAKASTRPCVNADRADNWLCLVWREGAERRDLMRPWVPHSGGSGNGIRPGRRRLAAEMRPGRAICFPPLGAVGRPVAWLSPWMRARGLKNAPWVGRQQTRCAWALAPFNLTSELGD